MIESFQETLHQLRASLRLPKGLGVRHPRSGGRRGRPHHAGAAAAVPAAATAW